MAEVLEPLKTEMVEKEDFEKLDLRVMEIVDCEEDDRSRAFMKLTVFDGFENRTIMSSIKGIYTCEELIGRKIVVLANLKPKKFSGVKSHGMLLAAEYPDYSCKLIFVDKDVPTGYVID